MLAQDRNNQVISSATGEASPQPKLQGAVGPDNVSAIQVFTEFLLVGAISFGGGVVAYLRRSLVAKRQWMDDKQFVELHSISQSLPGLNATNMAVLVGDRLRGAAGAVAAICGVCLPGGLLMYVVAIAYHARGDRPLIVAMLKGVAAAAVGLILAAVVQLSRKSLVDAYDLVFVVIAVAGVNRLHQSVPRVLIVVGICATLWHHFRRRPQEKAHP